MMFASSAVMFGTFLLTSLYMQDVLGAGPLETGLAFLPVALVIGAGAHVGSHIVRHAGVRVPMAAALAVTAAGMALLAGVDADGSYFADVLPGMAIAGLGLGVTVVCVAVAVLTGAEDEESGMLSGMNTTGHEIGGSLGVAVLLTIVTAAGGELGSPISVTGLGDAYLAAAVIAGVSSVFALVILPPARSFVPRLRMAPSVPIH
jgi:hypothetical protein